MKLYGIKTCDTCRKALKAFEAAEKVVTYIDLRADGFSQADLVRWMQAVGWETLLNKRSTTWRALPEEDKANPTETTARTLMQANPTLIKRPIFDDGSTIIVGFAKSQQTELLG